MRKTREIKKRFLHINYMDTLLVLLTVLLVVTMLKKDTTDAQALEPKAEYLVELTWEDSARSDIDLWFRTPEGLTISYIRKQASVYSLDRDDLGWRNDAVRDVDGTTRVIPINREIVTMRGWTAGTYTVNVFVYAWNDPRPINARVRVIRLNPFREVITRELELSRDGQEFTAASFTLNEAGDVTYISDDQVSVIR